METSERRSEKVNGSQRCIATIEARMTSSRLPGKVLMPAGGKPLLQILIERLRRVSKIDAIVVATTINKADDSIATLASNIGVSCFRGSEQDVLDRVCGALKANDAQIAVEVTGDCPLIDPLVVEEAIDAFLETQDTHPYVSNSDPHRSVPAGLDVQVFSAEALYRLSSETQDPQDREHVSYGFYRPESRGRWNPRFITHESCRGGEKLWMSLDYPEDYALIRAAHEALVQQNPFYAAPEIIRWVKAHPDLHERCLARRQESLLA
jgi:spore coat polysaccharide biosynthesis protein SpsF